MLTDPAARLAVWGDPIDHSRSPDLHAAAFGILGLEWSYGRRQVTASAFDAALGELDASWRGLSLTFPLKGAAHRSAATLDRRAELTGAVNTLLLTEGGPHGFNTDIGGIVASLADEGIHAAETARIVGAGATATSALVALAEIDVRRVEVVARRVEAIRPMVEVGETLGVEVTGAAFSSPFDPVDLTVATLPGDTELPEATASRLAEAGGTLLDVVYGTWPTALAASWERAGSTAVSGLGMLLHQAVLQDRIFVSGGVEVVLDDEPAVIAAMRLVIMGD